MIPALQQKDARSVNAIDQPVFLRDPARPRVEAFQPLRFAEPRARVTRDAFEQFKDLGDHSRLRLDPEPEILDEIRVND
jgi:hypothetical protein